jgi:hypothetical protein
VSHEVVVVVVVVAAVVVVAMAVVASVQTCPPVFSFLRLHRTKYVSSRTLYGLCYLLPVVTARSVMQRPADFTARVRSFPALTTVVVLEACGAPRCSG